MAELKKKKIPIWWHDPKTWTRPENLLLNFIPLSLSIGGSNVSYSMWENQITMKPQDCWQIISLETKLFSQLLTWLMYFISSVSGL